MHYFTVTKLSWLPTYVGVENLTRDVTVSSSEVISSEALLSRKKNPGISNQNQNLCHFLGLNLQSILGFSMPESFPKRCNMRGIRKLQAYQYDEQKHLIKRFGTRYSCLWRHKPVFDRHFNQLLRSWHSPIWKALIKNLTGWLRIALSLSWENNETKFWW